MKYHVPVLLNESVNGLSIKPSGTYVDLTFGGGGHSKLILEKLNLNGKLFSFDTDDDAIKENKIKNDNFHLIQSNFKFFDLHIKERGINKVDGILADLGVSSHQIDNKERGFSYMGNNKLDSKPFLTIILFLEASGKTDLSLEGKTSLPLASNLHSCSPVKKAISEY